MATTPVADVVDAILGIESGSELDALREGRPLVKQRTQSTYEALFHPPAPGGLTVGERLAVAARVAEHSGSGPLAAHFRDKLGAAVVSSRRAAMLAHADLVARTPAQAGPSDLGVLAAAGLSTAEIVTLSQVIAYVSYLARAILGLSLLADVEFAPEAAATGAAAARDQAFTTEALDWKPWLDVVDPCLATADQLAVLEESGAHALKSSYYHLLLHDWRVLRERSHLFNAIMYGPRGLPRAERELGATVESILNGCVYCTSVHARFYVELTKQPKTIEALFTSGLGAPLEPRPSAIVDFSSRLAATPPSPGSGSVAALRSVGLGNAEIFDLANAVAIFAWANRLMLTLGEPQVPHA